MAGIYYQGIELCLKILIGGKLPPCSSRDGITSESEIQQSHQNSWAI